MQRTKIQPRKGDGGRRQKLFLADTAFNTTGVITLIPFLNVSQPTFLQYHYTVYPLYVEDSMTFLVLNLGFVRLPARAKPSRGLAGDMMGEIGCLYES